MPYESSRRPIATPVRSRSRRQPADGHKPKDTANVVDLMAALKKNFPGGGGESAPQKGRNRVGQQVERKSRR